MHPVMENGKEVAKDYAKRAKDGPLLLHWEYPDGRTEDGRSKVSDDGKTMTDKWTIRSKDGKETKWNCVWHRLLEKKVARGLGARTCR